jgi:hypothetical protein
MQPLLPRSSAGVDVTKVQRRLSTGVTRVEYVPLAGVMRGTAFTNMWGPQPRDTGVRHLGDLPSLPVDDGAYEPEVVKNNSNVVACFPHCAPSLFALVSSPRPHRTMLLHALDDALACLQGHPRCQGGGVMRAQRGSRVPDPQRPAVLPTAAVKVPPSTEAPVLGKLRTAATGTQTRRPQVCNRPRRT